jgi:hypothetical protein
MNILFLVCRLLWSSLGARYVAVLIEIGFIESILSLDFTGELVLDQWIEFFARMSEEPTHHHYLLSIGILPRLVTIGQVTIPTTHITTLVNLSLPCLTLLQHITSAERDCIQELLETRTIEIIAHLSTNISSRIEDWIPIIPLLIDITGLDDDHDVVEVKGAQEVGTKRLDNSERAHTRSSALMIVKKIATAITQASHLHQLLDKDIRFMTYLKWTLHSSNNSSSSIDEETREGLQQLIIRFESIDPCVACLESFEWLRRELEEPRHSANQK